MPINPEIHRTMADIVRVRKSDIIDAVDYFNNVAGTIESAIVQPVHEVIGTMQHPFAHIHEELADTAPAITEPSNVVAMADYEHRRPVVTDMPSQPGTVTNLDTARYNVESATAGTHMSFEDMLKEAQNRPAA